MQKKHLIGAGITAFSVILGLLWLIPLIWLIGTALSLGFYFSGVWKKSRLI